MTDLLPEPLASLVNVPGLELHLHGPAHWKNVALTGNQLVRRDSRIDPLVVWLFSQLHDSQRISDQHDSEHGPRAAQAAQTLMAQGKIRIGRDQGQKLVDAISLHTAGKTATDVTIGACWDADRLNLWRVGIAPDVKYLSTPAARRSFDKLSQYAAKLCLSDPPSWKAVERCVI
jgi:uncharacterized protein